jgi:L-alanine-DL-glutamate epimerase-like enolase superfamily enzyme
VGRKRLAFCAYSAVDVALWDIKGKYLGMPLYKLLGGNKKDIPVYASGGWTSFSRDELVEEALRMVGQGYNKIKVTVGVEAERKFFRWRNRKHGYGLKRQLKPTILRESLARYKRCKGEKANEKG